LKSICIPASVEILCAGCFEACCPLSSLTFESGSKLKEIEEKVFCHCLFLHALSIPASVKKIHGSAFTDSGISMIVVGEGNADLAFCGGFLISVTETSVVRYFGHRQAVTLPTEIESFSPSSLSLEPGLKLRRIGAGAFAHLSKLESISIPATIESLGE
jgi:hypothetical protein